MISRNFFLGRFLFVLIFILFLAQASAVEIANFTLNNPSALITRAENNTLNFTIGAIENSNITKVFITFTVSNSDPDFFVINTNFTSASAVNFTNTTHGSISTVTNLTFSNSSSGTVVIVNGTTQTFGFNVSARQGNFGQLGSFLSVTITATNQSGSTNSSTFSFQPAFSFSGYIRNETGCSTCWQEGVNVSVYGIARGSFSAPSTATLLASGLTNASGYFKVLNINASSAFDSFKLNTIYYNNSNATFSNLTGPALKVGSILPDFPSQMFYGGFGDDGFDMSLNGGTFYLQPAATLKLYANNGSTNVSFGYELIDQALGFPISSEVLSKVTNANVTVPANRNYTISFFRMPSFFGSNVGYTINESFCNSTSDFMNNSLCPAPPKAVPIVNLNSSQIVVVEQNLVVRKSNLHGCISLNSGANNSVVNITSLYIKMLPWSTAAGSFIPPRSGDDGFINLTRDVNMSVNGQAPHAAGTGCFAYYNLSLLNNTGYFLEFYATNGTNASSNPGTAYNLAGFLNVTSSDNRQANLTLYRLAGSYRTTALHGVNVNSSLVRVNVLNGSGSPITTYLSANMKVKNTASGVGTLYYMVEPNLSGTFFIPVLNNSNYAKVMIFGNNAPPKEISLNLSMSDINITLVSFGGNDRGFRKFNSSGGLEIMNATQNPVSMRFLQNTPACSVPNAPSSCVITEMNATSFNPLKALLAGKVHMEIKITSTNVTLLFKDYDMMSARQPPMESVMDDEATSRSNNAGNIQEKWNFGSFAPVDSYSNVTVIIPYSDSSSASNYINDSVQVNASIPELLDHNNAPVWNKTKGDSYINLSDDFIEYNQSYYRNYLEGNGSICATTGVNNTCFVNTSANYILMNLPHFSTVGASVIGTGVPVSSDSPGSSGGGGGGGGSSSSSNGNNFWTNTYAEDSKELKASGTVSRSIGVGERVRIKINNETHHVGIIGITDKQATINVSSNPQQATLNLEESKSFDVDGNGYYDLSISLASINSTSKKAELKIRYAEGIVPTSPNLDNVQNNNEVTEDESIKENKASKSLIIKIILAVIILIIIILVIVKFREKDISHKVKISSRSRDIRVH